MTALRDILTMHGYTDLRQIGDQVCGLRRMVFTTGLCVGLTEYGYDSRYCFEHEADARAALLAWDGRSDPPGPWIKNKGLGIDRLNPQLSTEGV